MNRKQEFEYKLSLMREYMKNKKADGLLFQRSDTFAWGTCGGSDHVNTATDSGVAALFVTPRDCAVITNRIEDGRLMDEEIRDLSIEIESIPWAENRDSYILENKIESKKVLTDSPIGGLPALPADFTDLMMTLTWPEIARFRSLGADTGTAIEDAARAISPGMTEFDAAALLSAECYRRGVVPIVALIAADGRLKKYRHPLPTGNRFKKTIMLVVCGRRHGLIASATRIVSVAPMNKDLRRRHDACVQVDAVFNTLTRPGVPYADIFRAAMKTYRESGFDGEWRLHHQGGPAGYRTRYFTANEKTKGVVPTRSAFAWNPSITGTKSEDTILVLDHGNEFITQTGKWPYLEVRIEGKKLARPDILVI